MIAASDPVEFIPHGRTILSKHPGQIYGKGHSNSASENNLLYKLTNFAIKDEGLVEAKANKDQEWWCIREVYYRGSDVLQEDPDTTKDAKFEYMSESYRPQSRLKTEFNNSIKSELTIVTKHAEVDINSAGTSQGGSANSSSNMSKKFNLSYGKSKGFKEKPLNHNTDCSYEEELYVKGCTAVWSKGLISTPGAKQAGTEQRETIACYTLENPIKHAIFCNFFTTINNTMLIDALNSQIGDVKKNIKIEDTTEHLTTKIMSAILLIDSKCMRVFDTDGREYLANLPFQVKRVWPMKYGVLFEKEATPLLHNSILPTSLFKMNESQNSTLSRSKINSHFNMSAKLRAESISGFEPDIPLPTCFSLSHPLDEVTPVLMKSPSQGLQYYNDGDFQIIFVSTNPSIILLYDWKTYTHSLWKIRKALRDECLAMCPNVNSTTTLFSQSCDYALQSPMHSNLGKNTTSWATGIGSPYHTKKSPGTPNFSRSKLNSPMAHIFHQHGISPQASIDQASYLSMVANTVPQNPPSLPLYPDVCLEHIWTDSQPVMRDPIQSANDIKAFLHTDLVDRDHLCYMVKAGAVSRLNIMRLQKSHSYGNTSKTNLIVGAVSTVAAKDAETLKHLKMIALVDDSGNIILQSGNSFVGKVHIGGVLARLIDSPYTKRSRFHSPFPRRSSLLPTRNNESTFDDSTLHLLSPVPHSSQEHNTDSLGIVSVVVGGGDVLCAGRRGGRTGLRVRLPPRASSPLLSRAQEAVAAFLPRELTLQFLIKWYGVRNAPGTQDLTPEQEWSMFTNLIYTLLGYDIEKLSQVTESSDQSDHSESATKKQRTSNDGTQDDWDYLLNTKLHKTMGNSLANILNLKNHNPDYKQIKYITNDEEEEKLVQFNTNALLFPYIAQIFYSFHLLYEDLKLNTLFYNDLKPMSVFLYQLARDLRLDEYVNHYWLDFPIDLNLDYDANDSQVTDGILKGLNKPSYFSSEPPSVFSYFNSMLIEDDVGHYPYLVNVNNFTKDLIEVLILSGCGKNAGARSASNREWSSSTPDPTTKNKRSPVMMLCDKGITSTDIDHLPCALSLAILRLVISERDCPITSNLAACKLLARHDLATILEETDRENETLEKEHVFTQKLNIHPAEETAQNKNDDSDTTTGMEHLNTKLLSLLYSNDHRMTEVFNLLQSSIPVTINLAQRPEVSDHEFIEEQEKHLFALSTRTMALPVSRGMLTLLSVPCSPTETITIPKLNVSGRGPPPRCNTIPLTSENAGWLNWPNFHNGVATGLSLVPSKGHMIDSTWLTYNKPKGTQELSSEHAGFLLGLGLNGHLKDMPLMSMYEYLVKCNEMISIGLLLGLAATYKGSMDTQATKLMSIHLSALLPPTPVELDQAGGVKAAALLGMGLLHAATNHPQHSATLLNEIGRPPGPDTENCLERESYALSAGLALGIVCVGAGQNFSSRIIHTLHTYISPWHHNNKTMAPGLDKARCPSSGSDAAGAGAMLALGLVLLRSGSARAASCLAPPRTAYQLAAARPDLLLLAQIARGLILWDSIEASVEFIEQQVPENIKEHCFVKPTDDNIDYEAVNQAYYAIIAGWVFALGLRFAGSGCIEARDVALHYATSVLNAGSRAMAEIPGKTALDTANSLCLLAAGMIMAGRGDLEVLRLCRRVRSKVLPPSALTHGGQMAVHSTIGLLFLGGGRCTLSTSPLAIAALVAAFFPKFPTHSEDNRYHLQAFRHLYVLAVEARLLLPRDLNTGKICYTHIQVVDLNGVSKEMIAPCLVPELNSLTAVHIRDPRYWPLSLTQEDGWARFKNILENTSCIDIQQRAGCLSYLDDPQGFLTILAQTLTLDKANIWSSQPENIELFTNDERIKNFVKHYLQKGSESSNICADCLIITKKKKCSKSDGSLSKECLCRKYSKDEKEYVQGLCMVTYECVVKDILNVLPVWTTFLKIIKTMKTEPSSYQIWQIKLLLAQIENHNKRSLNEMKIDGQESNCEPLISTEFTMAIKQKVSNIFDSWEPKITPFLRKYLGLPSSRKINTCDNYTKSILSAFLVFNDLRKSILNCLSSDNELALLLELQGLNLSVEALSKVQGLVR